MFLSKGVDFKEVHFTVFLNLNTNRKKEKHKYFYTFTANKANIVGSVVERLKRRDHDQHGLGSKPTCAILLCFWERHFTTLSPAWWSWKAVLN